MSACPSGERAQLEQMAHRISFDAPRMVLKMILLDDWMMSHVDFDVDIGIRYDTK